MPLRKKAPHKAHPSHADKRLTHDMHGELPVLAPIDDATIVAHTPVEEPVKKRTWFGWLKHLRPNSVPTRETVPVESTIDADSPLTHVREQTPQGEVIEEVDLKPLDEESKPSQPHNIAVTEKDAEIEKGLKAIYMGNDGALPDLSHLERGRSRRWLWALAILGGVVSLLAVASWLGFFFFQPFREYRGGGLQLSVTGPSSISLGKEEQFEIDWQNVEKASISHVEVRVGLPPDFVPTSFEPPLSKEDVRSWQLDSVNEGGKGKLFVRGIFTGALGTNSAVQAIGTYRPAGFNRDFEALATQPVTYANTVLEGTWTGPEKTAVGENVTFTYTVVSNGDRPLKNLSARITYPSGFVPSLGASTSVAVGDHQLFIPIGEIASGTRASVSITGVFIAGVSGDQAFVAQAGRYGSDGTFLPAQTTNDSVNVMAGDLALQFVVNGSDTDRTIQPGDLLRITIGYQNTSPEPLKGISLVLGFESVVNGQSATGTTLLDWSKLEQLHAGVSSTKTRIQTIRYDKTTTPELETLIPQGEGTIELSIPTLAVASGTHDAAIKLTLQANVANVGATKVNRVLNAQPMTLRERSDADVSAEARYFTEEGAPVGFGPLPPVAGKTTAYLVTWHVTKTLHPLDQVTVTAVLPKIAAWSARVLSDAGSITYNPETREVKWVLENVPESVKDLSASFEVQITPDTLDIGRFAAVLGETQFSAVDPVVKETITKAKPPLTTDLQNDEGARGKGVVRKP